MSEVLQPYHPRQVLQKHVANSQRSLEELPFIRPVSMAPAIFEGSKPDLIQIRFLQEIKASLGSAGHTFQEQPFPDSDMIFTFYTIPGGYSSLYERIPEIDPPHIVRVRDNYDIEGLHPNLVLVATIEDDLASMSHVDVEDLSRMVMGRIGVFKVLFIHENPETDTMDYFVFSTMEGGHPVIRVSDKNCFDELRDRLVTQACAKEAGGYEAVEDILVPEDWETSWTPDFLVYAGRTLGELGVLDEPMNVSRWVSEERARLIRFLVGWQRQSAGAILAFAPDLNPPRGYEMNGFTGLPVVTCSGRWEVDKKHLRRNEDLITVSMQDGLLYALGVSGGRVKGPSIEGDELVGGMMATPQVRLSRFGERYVADSNGGIVVPKIRAILHTHRGVEEVRPIKVDGRDVHVVSQVLPNLDDFPHAVGCGKDIMFDMSRDAISRAMAVSSTSTDIVVYVYDVINHGTNFFLVTASLPGEKGIPADPFEHLLRLLDPHDLNAITLTTEIPQI